MARHPQRRRIVAAATLDPRSVAGYLPNRSAAGPNPTAASDPWELYRRVPELQSGIEWLANAVSRADMYVAQRTPDGLEPVDDPLVTEILDEVFGPGGVQGDMIARFVTHLEVPGESFLCPYQREGQRDLTWVAASPSEIRSIGRGIEYQVDVNEWAPVVGERITRLWHADREHGWRAHSGVLAMEPLLRQIIAMTARSTANNESRLAGNGILGLSDGLATPSATSEGTANPVRSPDAITALEDAMVQPMTDRGLVSAVAPFVLVGPRDDIANGIKYISMTSPLDERLSEQLEQALRRMAISMSLPPELILGLGETNHWNAEEIANQAVTTTFEPYADRIRKALTIGVLIPELRRRRIKLPGAEVAADLSDLTVHPDRSEDAQAARERGLLTDEAWARYLGFDRGDMPRGRERERIILEQVLANNPDAAPYILPALGIHVPGWTITATSSDTPSPANPPPPPPADEDPSAASEDAPQEDGDEEPDEEPSGRRAALGLPTPDPEDALLTAVEAAVIRVLERAGNRLLRAHSRSARPDRREVPPIDMHVHLPVTAALRERILRGAYDVWEDSLPGLVPVVASYVDYLIDNRLPHTRELLADTLTRVAAEQAAEDELARAAGELELTDA